MVKAYNLKTLKGLFTLFLLVLLISNKATAQNEVAIGSSTTKSNAILWLNGNGSQGLILPIVTSKSAVAGPEKGMIVYDNTDNKVWYRNDNAWIEVGGSTGGGGDNGTLALLIQGNKLQLKDGATILSSIDIAGGTASNGAFMVWNGTSWQYATLNGDVSGANGALQVDGIKGKSVPALPTTTQALVYDGTAWKFQPLSAATTTPVLKAGEILIGNGTANSAALLSGDATLSAGALTIGNNAITNAKINANAVDATKLADGSVTSAKIQDGTIAAADLNAMGATPNQVLQWNGTTWKPATIAVGITTVTAGTGLTGGGVTPTVTLGLANTTVSQGIYGSTTTIPQLTIDAQGRITSAVPQTIPTASTTTTGLLSNTDWNTFNSKGNGTVTSVTGTSPISVATGTTTPAISISQANGTTNGFLSSADWATFNAKGNGTVTSVTGSGPISVATGTTTPAISMTQAGASTNGFLSSADWNTFNTKQGALSLTTTGTSGAATLAGNVLNIPQYASTYSAGTGLTLAANTFSVNTSQNIATLSNLTSNGLVKTSGGTGALSIATAGTDYLVPNAAITGGTFTKVTYDSKGLVTSGANLSVTDLPTMTSTTGGAVPTPPNNTTTFLRGDGTFATPTGGGTVTNVSVVSANGFTGSVATSTSTPAITIGTTLTGVLKGDGTGLSVATAGTDYLTPTGSAALLTGFPILNQNTTGTASTITGNIAQSQVTNLVTDLAAKQPQLNGTGLVRATGTTISYDNSAYLTSFTETDPSVAAINGLVKSNGTTITAAVAGTDYLTPTGSAAFLTGFPTFNQNTTGNAGTATALQTGRTIGMTGDVTYTSPSFNGTSNVTAVSTVTGINNTSLAGLATGILKNTTGTGVPSIAVAGDFPILNQNTTGNAATVTTNANLTGPVTSVGNTTSIAAGAITNAMLANTAVANLSGVNTGDQTITLTGDVTGSGTGSFATTLATVPVAKGGTGLTTFGGLNTLLYTTAANTLSSIPTNNTSALVTSSAGVPSFTSGVTANRVLRTDGTTISFGQANLATDVTGNLPVTNLAGGTGATASTFWRGDGTWAVPAGGSSGWNLNGNVSTIPGTDFLGTTDAQDLVFKTNNVEQLRLTSGGVLQVTGQVKITGGAPAANYVLTSVDATGLATWQNPGAVVTGGWGLLGNAGLTAANFIGTTTNVPLNFRANNQKSGTIDPITENTFLGFQAGNVTTATGVQNTAIGNNAFLANTTGLENVAVGLNALQAAVNSDGNTAIGKSALFAANAPGHQGLNTAVGYSVMYQTTTGTSNTAIGTSAGENNVAGSYNTYVGQFAQSSSGNLNYASAIGVDAIVSASNTMVFGSQSGSSMVVGWGFGAQPGTAAIRVGTGATNGSGATLTKAGVWTNASDSTRKFNIKPINYGLNEIMKLKPVNYQMKGTGQKDFGFLAQEVKTILPEIVYGEEGQMTLSYSQITAVLTKAMQEQQLEIEELKAKLKEKEDKVNNLEGSVTTMKDELENIKRVLGMEAKAKTAGTNK